LVICGDREPRYQLCAVLPLEKLPASHLGRMPESSLKSSRIAILNPLPGAARSLGYEHARRYVKQGRAQWVNRDAIRFLPEHHRHQSAERLLRQQTAAGYDARGLLTIEEIKQVPVTGEAALLLVRRSAVQR
jgi:hypothetical protein